MDDHELFERERDGLLSEVVQTMEQVISKINTLNNNLENIATLGRDFEQIAALWSEFRALLASDTTNTDNNNS